MIIKNKTSNQGYISNTILVPLVILISLGVVYLYMNNKKVNHIINSTVKSLKLKKDKYSRPKKVGKKFTDKYPNIINNYKKTEFRKPTSDNSEISQDLIKYELKRNRLLVKMIEYKNKEAAIKKFQKDYDQWEETFIGDKQGKSKIEFKSNKINVSFSWLEENKIKIITISKPEQKEIDNYFVVEKTIKEIPAFIDAF